MRLTQSIRWLHLYLPIVLLVNSSLCYAGLAWARLSRVHSMHMAVKLSGHAITRYVAAVFSRRPCGRCRVGCNSAPVVRHKFVLGTRHVAAYFCAHCFEALDAHIRISRNSARRSSMPCPGASARAVFTQILV